MRRLGNAADQSDVLLREKAFRDDHEQKDGESQRGKEHAQRYALVSHDQIEPALVGMQERVEGVEVS